MDYRKLEGLESFSKFFDFIQNPEEFRALIADANKAVKEFNESTLKARQIRDIDLFRADVTSKLDAKERALVEKEVDFEKRVREAAKAIGDRELLQADKELDFTNRVKEVTIREQKVADLKIKETQYSIEVKALEEDKVNFQKTVIEFNQKRDALNALMRG